jgi:hypothetical protein
LKSEFERVTLTTAATGTHNEEAIAAAKTANSKYLNGYKKLWEKGKNPASKAKADHDVGPTLMSMFNTAVDAIDAAAGPKTYNLKVKSQSSPKFMHNAMSAGTLPVWKYEYWEEGNEGHKSEFDMHMTVNMEGDENHQAKAISDAAIALVKSHHTGATVKLVR